VVTEAAVDGSQGDAPYGNNCGGWASLTVNDNDGDPQAVLYATDKYDVSDPNGNANIEDGDPAYLVSACENSDSAEIDQKVGPVNPDGDTKQVTPGADQSPITYTLTCTNSITHKSAEDTAMVTIDGIVQQSPTCSLTPPSQEIDYGDAATLSWDSQNTISCRSDNTEFNSKMHGATSGGPVDVHPTSDTSYDLICSDDQGEQCPAAAATVKVSIAGDCSITTDQDPPIVKRGTNATINWNMTNQYATCTETGPGLNESSLSGKKSIQINSQSVYNIACTLGTLTCNDSITVRIAPDYQEH
jgi:hypothetical protein